MSLRSLPTKPTPTRLQARRTLLLALGFSSVLVALPAWAEGSQPSRTSMFVGWSQETFSESFSAQSLSSQTPVLDSYAVHGLWSLNKDNQLWLRVSCADYSLADQLFPGTTHRRMETNVTLGDVWTFHPLGSEFGMGLGYSLRNIQVANSARSPYSDPDVLFADWQRYHGPALLETFYHPLIGPLGMSIRTELVALPFNAFSDPRIAVAPMAAVRCNPCLALWDERLSVGYVYERALGQDYSRESSGVSATLSLTGF